MNGFTLFAANEKTFLLLYLYKTLYVKSVLCSEVQHLLKVFHFSIFRVPPELILAAGAWSPPQAHLAFGFFTKTKILWPLFEKCGSPGKSTWPPTPPQKSEWSVLFSSSHIFVFFLQFKLCSKFLRISKIRLYSNLCRCRFFKIHRPQKSGISKIYLHCGPNFWPPRFLRSFNFEKFAFA